jgi:hypothetical protein
MPVSASVGDTDGFTILAPVRQDEDFRVLWQQEFRQHMLLQFSEAPTEGYLCVWREILITDDDNAVADESAVNCLELLIVPPLVHVRAGHLCGKTVG